MSVLRFTRRASAALAVAGALTLTVAACSSSSGGSSGGGGGSGLPGEVKVLSLRQLTGISSFAGTNAKKGSDLALDEIAQQKFLGDTKLTFDTKDATQTTQQAASLASQGVADKSYSLIFGPEASAQAAAVSAITQKSKVPTVYIQAGSSSVMAGDYIYRLTAPVYSYFDVAGQYLKDKGVTKAAIIYSSENPTLTQLGKETIPGMASKYGFEVTSTDTTTNTANDFTSFATKMAQSKPGAVFLMLQGGQDPTAITQLKSAGYQGEFIGMSAMGAGNLKPAGDTAKGAVWATDFTATQPGDTTAAFVKAYEAKYSGEVPNNYAAEAYDATWFIARALKAANSADREKVLGGMQQVAKEGFDGAMGKLTFDGTDLRVAGTMAEWTGSGEQAVAVSSS
jgi:branched-chain amino acid transport system substrate-binding protein